MSETNGENDEGYEIQITLIMDKNLDDGIEAIMRSTHASKTEVIAKAFSLFIACHEQAKNKGRGLWIMDKDGTPLHEIIGY